MAKKTAAVYENKRLPLIGSMSNRSFSGDKDQRFVNVFPETRKVDQIESIKIYLQKRPGLTTYKTFGSGEGRGIFKFNGVFYVAVGNTLWKDGVIPTGVITFTGSTGLVSGIVGNSSTIGDYIFICDGTKGWVIETNGTVTEVTDIDFPTPHVISPTFLDGYIFLAKGSDIYNCDLDDPLSWNGTNFITAELFPDPVIALARQNNQLVAFGSSSVEFYYDAANASGSPLSKNDGTIIQIGCAAAHAIYQNERYCAFIGQSDSGGRAVWFIDGFKPNKVSDEYIERIIDQESNLSTCQGFGFRVFGHMFYLFNLITVNRTLVYDIDEQLWHEWSSNDGSGNHSVFNCNHYVDGGDGFNYVLHTSDGDVYKLDTSSYIDADHGNILVELVTNKYDMDTYNRKFMSTLVIVGDEYAANPIDISWSDDDYRTWNTPITIVLDDSYPTIKKLGQFRRRAFKLEHTSNYPLRLESLEVCFKEGLH
jgi:hypothetical protein